MPADFGGTRQMRGPFAAGEPARYRRKQIASMKARGQRLGAPQDLPSSGGLRPSRDKLKQAVVRTDIPAPFRLDNNRSARAAHTGIDHREHDGARRKPSPISGQQIGGRFGPSRWCIGKEFDDRNPRRHLVQDRLDLAGIGSLETKIGEQHDHRRAVGAAESGSPHHRKGRCSTSGIFIGARVVDVTVVSSMPTTFRFLDFSVKFSFVFDARIKKAHCKAINGWATAGYFTKRTSICSSALQRTNLTTRRVALEIGQWPSMLLPLSRTLIELGE